MKIKKDLFIYQYLTVNFSQILINIKKVHLIKKISILQEF